MGQEFSPGPPLTGKDVRGLSSNEQWSGRPDPTGGSVVPYSGTSDPGVNDGNTQGHVAGITGVNTSTGDMFICLDASTGAAVWQALYS